LNGKLDVSFFVDQVAKMNPGAAELQAKAI